MSRPLVLGVSLKTYFSHARTLEWTTEVAATLDRAEAVADGRIEFFVAPTFPALKDVVQILSPHPVGAQDVSATGPGAYTGEVNAAELVEIGVRMAEIGHAERRRLFGETSRDIRAKCDQALHHGLTPILCVGEPDRTEPDLAVATVIAQVEDALLGTDRVVLRDRVIIAYEPHWAIGADRPASADYVRRVCHTTRRHLERRLPELVLLYGGSAGPGTLAELGPSVDGLFMGRFVHDARNVAAVIEEATLMLDQASSHNA